MGENNVTDILLSTADYGAQLAAVFHSYLLTAEKVPSGLEGAVNILDATVMTLKQILKFLREKHEKPLFNENGLQYIGILISECATTLAKIEPAIDEAYLPRQEREALQKKKRKLVFKNLATVVDPLVLKLDEKELLEKIERTKWAIAIDDVDDCTERLYELQLHLHLISQVGSLVLLSRDT